MDTLKLRKVQYLPKELQPGILYVSEEFAVAGHLCPCGCGNKIMTPLVSTEWTYTETNNQPSLFPSIGNWQLPCRSHYWIKNGRVEWSYQWDEKQIKKAWDFEEKGRKTHFKKRTDVYQKLSNFVNRLWKKVIKYFKNI